MFGDLLYDFFAEKVVNREQGRKCQAFQPNWPMGDWGQVLTMDQRHVVQLLLKSWSRGWSGYFANQFGWPSKKSVIWVVEPQEKAMNFRPGREDVASQRAHYERRPR